MCITIASVGVSLSELFPTAQFAGAHNIQAASCCSDWRQVEHGDVYVAVVDAEHDGHDFAAEAVEKGAVAVISERPLPVFGTPQIVVEDSRVALGQLCHALVQETRQDLGVIGVTGSSGKSSVVRLLQSVIDVAGGQAGVTGTLGYSDGFQSVSAGSTTPSAPTLAHWLGRMAAAGCSHGVVEVSEQALAQSRTAGLELDVACITNIESDQIGPHQSVHDYRAVNGRIFDQLREGGVAVLNADDPSCCRFAAEGNHPLLTFGMRQPADVTAEIIERCVGEQTFMLTAGSDSVLVRTRIVGSAHVANCLAAAAVGLALGIDLPTIARGLEAVDRISGRMDRVECGQRYSVWVDAADSPKRLRSSLEAMRSVASGDVICVVHTQSDEDTRQIDAIRQVANQLADTSIVVESKSRSTVDRAAMIEWALRRAQPGDAVLIASNQSPAGDRCREDEYQAVREYLYHSQASVSLGKAA